MTEEESLNLAINEKITIFPYDSSWPSLFEIERDRLLNLLPECLLEIEHVGSTAVPNCPAKPIIDIVASVKSIQIADEILPILCSSSYTTSEEFNKSLVSSKWLMRHENGKRTFHLHLVLENSYEWNNKLKFRDMLRRDDVLLNKYIKLKLSLMNEFKEDREAYTRAKDGFIREALGTLA
jgi:GrpB-like predicted nucleotidyltransferase (UPF0157 family)